jgi:hypothetical protein
MSRITHIAGRYLPHRSAAAPLTQQLCPYYLAHAAAA